MLFNHWVCIFYCDLDIVFNPRYKTEKKTGITFIFIEISKAYRHIQFIKNKLQPMKSYLSWIELESCHSCDWKKFNVPCCCSVTELCLIFETPWTAAHKASLCASDSEDSASPSPRVCSNSCALSWWCCPTISSFVARPFLPALSLSQHQSLSQ